MYNSNLLALAASIGSVSAAVQGMNYGAETDFATAFATQKALAGTNGAFTSARLYTTVDPAGGPTSAIPAAINSGTHLLLGLWASAGQANIDNEIAALKQAIATYGAPFANLVNGISVGSEDLYRNSPTGIINKSGIGANPADLISYISQVRAAIAGTVLSSAPVGHVDTWTAWVNGSNSDVVSACDFVGTDAYPYFQSTQANGIDNAADLFFSAYDQTVAASQGKKVIVAESGWPTTGPTSGAAVPSVQNAQTYWDAVACKLFQTTDTYWYILADAGASPSFGVSSSISDSTPLYNLTCPVAGATASSSSSMAASATSSVASSSAAGTSGSTAAAGGATVSAGTSAAASASVSASASVVSSAAGSVAATQSAVPTAIGAGSPQAVNSASYDSAVASYMTAHPMSYSAVVASASAAASAASTMSLATSASGYVVGTASVASGTTSATSSHAASGTAASSRAASGTAGASPASYTGAAASNTVGALGGILAAAFAALALF